MIRVFRTGKDEVRIFAGEYEIRVIEMGQGEKPLVQFFPLEDPLERMKRLTKYARQMFTPSSEEEILP